MHTGEQTHPTLTADTRCQNAGVLQQQMNWPLCCLSLQRKVSCEGTAHTKLSALGAPRLYSLQIAFKMSAALSRAIRSQHRSVVWAWHFNVKLKSLHISQDCISVQSQLEQMRMYTEMGNTSLVVLPETREGTRAKNCVDAHEVIL